MRTHLSPYILFILLLVSSIPLLGQVDTFPTTFELKTFKIYATKESQQAFLRQNLGPIKLEFYDSFNNKVKEGIYCYNFPTGRILEYYRNGNVKSITNYLHYSDSNFIYYRNLKHGESIYYDSLGSKTYSEFWENGKFVSQVPDQKTNEITQLIATLKDSIEIGQAIYVHELNELEFYPTFKSKYGLKDSVLVTFHIFNDFNSIVKKSIPISEVSTYDFKALLFKNGLTSYNKINCILSFQFPAQTQNNIASFRVKKFNMNLETKYNYYLVNNLNHKKRVPIKSSFSLYYKNPSYRYSLYNTTQFATSSILHHSEDSLYIKTHQNWTESKDTNAISYTLVDNRTKEIWVNKNQIYQIRYSSTLRSSTHMTSNVLLGISAFTSLFVAPLVSINYNTGDFNNNLYYKVAGAGLIGMSIGIPVSILTKDKKYSIIHKKSKNAWSIQGFPIQ